MNDLFSFPPPPDPIQIVKWTGQVRALLTALAGLGMGAAWLPQITDVQIGAYLGASATVLGLLTAVWSWYEKTLTAQHVHATVVATAVASARANVPVVATLATDVGASATIRRVTPNEADTAAVDLPPPMPPLPPFTHHGA
jgi:hypothetical protein